MRAPYPNLPSYSEIMARTDGPAGSGWGLFGDDDHIGTINLLSPEAVVSAASLVKRGATFNLDYELNAFAPPVSPYRRGIQHTVVSRHDGQVYDDFVSDFFLQGSSQIDGLRHHRHKIHGFYGNVPASAVEAGSPALGVQHIAQKGIAGRGVLLDVQRYLEEQGRPLDLATNSVIALSDLEGAAEAQGISFERGDILLLHTGWARHFLNDLTTEDRARIINERTFCGVEQSREMLAWIWDNHFSVLASDTVVVEVMPSIPTSPFETNVGRLMHPDLIALLGVCLGEMWKLDELAGDCARDGVYEFLLTAKPLNLVGGVGSPPNALAIK
ncbi:cyclase family protein [Mesorhizobium waimense]|uniref:Cyclase family protein n=1 Tax=Mesorhizobium waimense TaxID=1300307 RepID=A0A3A5JTT1_9HYPH|nr:cyclase family protein [Mesorhizobium waimense]RJT26120.1 cyclase family protein [Mesorhizobium waimense]